MLIRFLVKNLASFKDLTEFNMLPAKGLGKRLPHHLYQAASLEVLKLNAIYGANGAGKSNLIHLLALLKHFLTGGEMPIEWINQTFRFKENSDKEEVYLGLEFIKEGTPFYYGLTVKRGIVVEEELMVSGLGKKEDKILFLRTDNSDVKELKINFYPDLNADPVASLFPKFLETEILKRNESVLKYMRDRESPLFKVFRQVVDWFENDLQIILPRTKPGSLALLLDRNPALKAFSETCMGTFETGVSGIEIDTIPIDEYLGPDDKDIVDRLTADLRANPDKVSGFRTDIEDVVFVWENERAVAKRIKLTHKEDGGRSKFGLAEESDGTRRLLEYLPMLFTVIRSPKVFFIDEMERSLHSLIIKDLVKKFSDDKSTKGQLIFSTHESNLLDQSIFRPDEIWFAEKNKLGATELYPLSEFKEHHTLNIQKGYLNGRYGGVPFLGNLRDLNWDQYAKAVAV
jgi:AAA15 family ATPase/GTPase